MCPALSTARLTWHPRDLVLPLVLQPPKSAVEWGLCFVASHVSTASLLRDHSARPHLLGERWCLLKMQFVRRVAEVLSFGSPSPTLCFLREQHACRHIVASSHTPCGGLCSTSSRWQHVHVRRSQFCISWWPWGTRWAFALIAAAQLIIMCLIRYF